MPRGDRTGPLGSGPATGRRVGYCAGSPNPGFMAPGPGSGFGRGFGFRRGFGGGFGRFWGYSYPQAKPYPTFHPFTEEQEMGVLDDQAEMLEDELNQIKKRRIELKQQRKDKNITNK